MQLETWEKEVQQYVPTARHISKPIDWQAGDLHPPFASQPLLPLQPSLHHEMSELWFLRCLRRPLGSARARVERRRRVRVRGFIVDVAWENGADGLRDQGGGRGDGHGRDGDL